MATVRREFHRIIVSFRPEDVSPAVGVDDRVQFVCFDNEIFCFMPNTILLVFDYTNRNKIMTIKIVRDLNLSADGTHRLSLKNTKDIVEWVLKTFRGIEPL